MSTKILRNDGGPIKVDYSGDEYFFEESEERTVPAELADSLQFRYGHLGLRILHPGAKATPHPADLTSIDAPDLEVAVDRHEEPAVSTVDAKKRKK